MRHKRAPVQRPRRACHIVTTWRRCAFWVEACYNFKVYSINDHKRCKSEVRQMQA
ncbi:hypothetical protein Acr_14g0002110 [Actinidia rufa]|uniref:Uncharacterized protein n=1 Tax=Actinidia rufa TaxID=165716 RepID=A0A7J0FPF5_9ERIC|nr:hypothetical protein Acr_14g0002110 [Actinidia rufa]